MANLELIINLIIIALLLPTIIYAYKLNKNLKELRQNQKSLAQLVAALNDATFKAENSIPKLKTATEHSSEGLKEVVDNERADSLADRLENVISTGRTIQPQNIQNSAPDEKDAPINDRAAAELELLKALRAIK